VKPTVLERFLAKVSPEPVSGCWLWKGHVRRDGYGTFTEKRKTRGAHRMAWILLRGEIAAGLLVCHKCDQPCCVNPEHLFLGTHRENVHDMLRKGRARTGARHPFAKLNVEKVAQIRALLAQGLSQSEAARQWGVSVTTIHAIARGKTWREVKPLCGGESGADEP